MNAFWIPELGGMIYAMTGMVTTLHLIADEAGEYQGLSANYSGLGFAKMRFIAEAMPPEEFEAWAMGTKASSRFLTWAEYERLSEPSTIDTPFYYSEFENNLHNTIVMQFMGHDSSEKVPSQAGGHEGNAFESTFSPQTH